MAGFADMSLMCDEAGEDEEDGSRIAGQVMVVEHLELCRATNHTNKRLHRCGGEWMDGCVSDKCDAGDGKCD